MTQASLDLHLQGAYWSISGVFKGTAELVRQFVEAQPLGEPFTPATLLRLGTRKAIDLGLARLAKSGNLTRLARGIYVRPKSNKYVGIIPPESFKIAMARAGGNVEVQWRYADQAKTYPIIGATKPEHLADVIAALDFTLTDDKITDLEAPCVPHPVDGIVPPLPDEPPSITPPRI